MRLATLAWRGLRDRPLRTTLAAAGVMLGVALVTAAIVTGASAERAIRGAAADLIGEADLRLRAFDEGGFEPRTVQAVRSLGEVVAAAPVAERQLTVSTAPGPGEAVFSLRVYGVDPDAEALVRPEPLVAGRGLESGTRNEALVPASWAAEHGLGLGDELLLGGRQPDAPPLAIVGLLADRGLAATAGGEVLVMPRAALDAAFEAPAPIRYLDVDLGTDPGPTAVERILGVLTEPYVVETPADAAQRLTSAQAAFVEVALLFGIVALVAGAFLVANTLAMMLGERIRDVGLLRAAGATRRQVAGIVVRQAAAMGVVGSAAGVGVGIGLGWLMVGLLRSTRVTLVEGLALPFGGLLVAFLLGVGVTLLAGTGPAVRAARLPPLEALRPGWRRGDGLLERLRPILVAQLAGVVLAAIVLLAGGFEVPILAVALGAALLVAGGLAAAFVLEPIGRVVGRPFEWFFGAQGTLGRANLGRDRARTGLTVGAMLIALAAAVALGTVAESARAGAERWVSSILPGGHAIRTTVPLEPDAFRPTLEATTGLRVASPVLERAVVRSTPEGVEEAWLAGIDPNVFADEGALLVGGASRAEAFAALREGNAVLVPAALAERAGIRVGQSMTLGLPGASGTDFTVAGIVEYSLPGRTPDGALLVSAADARDRFGATTASLWLMVPEPGIAESAFASAVRATANDLAAEALTARDLADELIRPLDALVGLFDALALVAVAIAALGIVNTLSVGVSERVREIAILRAHGMTVGQVQAMIVAEAAIMGVIAGVLAIVVGAVVAAMLVASGASPTELTGTFRLPWPLLVATVLIGMGVAALAGLYPARVAGSLPIVRNLSQFE